MHGNPLQFLVGCPVLNLRINVVRMDGQSLLGLSVRKAVTNPISILPKIGNINVSEHTVRLNVRDIKQISGSRCVLQPHATVKSSVRLGMILASEDPIAKNVYGAHAVALSDTPGRSKHVASNESWVLSHV